MKKICTLLLSILIINASQAQTQFINDPSFETGANSPIWGDKYIDNSGCIVSGANFGHTGDKCLSMIIEPNKASGGSAGQNFTVIDQNKLYNAKLEFYIKNSLASGSSNDLFAIGLNFQFLIGFLITGLTSDSASIGPNWKKVSINIDTLALGQNVLSIVWGNNIQGGVFSPSPNYSLYYVDDVTVTSGYPTAINEVSQHKAIITPTNFSNNIQIDFSNSNYKIAQIELYNIFGQKIISQSVSQSNAIINTSNINPGFYIATLLNEHGIVLQQNKLQKQ
jgi:Secretion system C-terminal sorting domain